MLEPVFHTPYLTLFNGFGVARRAINMTLMIILSLAKFLLPYPSCSDATDEDYDNVKLLISLRIPIS